MNHIIRDSCMRTKRASETQFLSISYLTENLDFDIGQTDSKFRLGNNQQTTT
jgi:hypothetical protein